MTLGGAAMVLLPTFIIVRHTLPQPLKAAVNGAHSRRLKFRKADKPAVRFRNTNVHLCAFEGVKLLLLTLCAHRT